MQENTIKVPFKKVDWIAHTADIHIRNLKRHKEYEEVFEKFYKELRTYSGNGIIYIGGDIAHAKTQMSPELVFQISKFFRNCADIAHTIVIPGNHDCNLNNPSRLDVLSPIIANLDHDQLHYLKDSGVYHIADIGFGVMSIFDEPKDYIKAKDFDADIKIALFHGTVANAETDFGFKLQSKIKINKFTGYDLGLLGDIHKFQFRNKKDTVAYCGSMICQNHGENRDKGFLKWDIHTLKAEFIQIENDYGYYTLDISDGKVPSVKDMPKKARLRLRVSDTDESQMKMVLAEIHKKYGLKDISVNRVDALSMQKKWDRTDRIMVGDVSDVTFQNGLIRDYLARNYILSGDMMSKVVDINTNLNGDLPEEEVVRNIFWSINTFKFSNMFSYGEDNVVDFSKLEGIVGMFAANAGGKSALLDAMAFCLFDTSSRAFKAINVMNNKKDYFSCEIGLTINGLEYGITRNAKRMKNGKAKLDVDFWMIDDSNEKVSLNGDSRYPTNANIRRVIGSYEDFILTSMQLQNNFSVFMDKGQRERKEVLAQFMGIGVFDQLYTLASENISEVKVVLKDFKKRDYGTELVTMEKLKTNMEKEHAELTKSSSIVEQEIETAQEKILKLHKKLKSVDKSIIDIDALNTEKSDLEAKQEVIETEITNSTSHHDGLVEKVEKLHEVQAKLSTADIGNQYRKLKAYSDERDLAQSDIDKLKIEVRYKLDKVEKLGNLQYDPNCTFCMANPFTLDAIETKKSIQDDKVLAGDYISRLNSIEAKIVDLGDVESDKIKFDRVLELLTSLGHEKDHTYANIEIHNERKKNAIKSILLVDEKIKQYYLKEKDILSNQKVNSDIDNNQTELDSKKLEFSGLSNLIQDKYSEVVVLDSKIEQILSDIEHIKSLEEEFEAYEYYLDAVKRDGIPYELIKKSLPTIEGAVNEILAQMVDFNIIIHMDGKNINTFIVYDDDNMWPLELSSGMERFVASLAIRVGLINVCNLPRNNALYLDEGFGSLDADNLNTIHMMFDYLKNTFPFIILVSHLENMRDIVDTQLEINKIGEYSEINYQ